MESLVTTNVILGVWVGAQLAIYATLGYYYWMQRRCSVVTNVETQIPDNLKYIACVDNSSMSTSESNPVSKYPAFAMRVNAINTIYLKKINSRSYYVTTTCIGELLHLLSEDSPSVEYVRYIVDTVHDANGDMRFPIRGGCEPYHSYWWNNLVKMVEDGDINEAQSLVSQYRDIIADPNSLVDDTAGNEYAVDPIVTL